jgi:recF protein
MRFLEIRLQDFRNIEFAGLDLSAPRNFLLGANGQGKSNLLEALGLVTALRSFRTQGLSVLPRQGQKGLTVWYRVAHEVQGETEIECQLGGSGRKVQVDGEPVTRLGDFMGRFPVVPMSSGDLMILRGSPAERRRFLDLTLASVDPEYYVALRRYHRAVAERNRLLKHKGSPAEFSAFEAEIARYGLRVVELRVAGMDALRAVLLEVYANIAEKDEGPEIEFRPNVVCDDLEAYRGVLRDSRTRDAMIGSTQKGPHRDDFNLSLTVGGAKDYASDGQQRGLCVALRIAQAKLFQERLGLAPVLLADDVLGELDPHRKAGFWRACPADLQIIASGTELPECETGGDWSIWNVDSGRFTV